VSRAQSIITAEDQIKLMRQGRDQELQLVCNGLEVPVRIIPAQEKAAAIANALVKLSVPANHDRELFESIATMKAVLRSAATISNVCSFAGNFLEMIGDKELLFLFNQYRELEKVIELQFESLSKEELFEFVSALKKKATTTRGLSTSRLEEIIGYFLEKESQQDSAAG
jgi:hypothetical protein